MGGNVIKGIIQTKMSSVIDIPKRMTFFSLKKDLIELIIDVKPDMTRHI